MCNFLLNTYIMKKEEWDRLLKQILNDLKGQEKEARSGFLLRLKWASG